MAIVRGCFLVFLGQKAKTINDLTHRMETTVGYAEVTERAARGRPNHGGAGRRGTCVPCRSSGTTGLRDSLVKTIWRKRLGVDGERPRESLQGRVTG